MDILSCPGALFTSVLNDLTILLNSSTVSCCNEIVSDREHHKKKKKKNVIGQRICGRYFTSQIWPDVGEVITKVTMCGYV